MRTTATRQRAPKGEHDRQAGRVVLAGLLITTYPEMDRHPDRELLVRARSALDLALEGR